jgi:hypothetical protein
MSRIIRYRDMYSGKGITFYMTGALNSNKGYAVTLETKTHAQNANGVYVKLAGDNDPVFGRLDAVLDQVRSATPSADVVTVTVSTEGLLELPTVSSSTSASFLTGTYIVGAGNGEVKELAASAATDGYHAQVIQYDNTNQKVIAYFR